MFWPKNPDIALLGAKFAREMPSNFNRNTNIQLFIAEINNPFKIWFNYVPSADNLDSLTETMKCVLTLRSNTLSFQDQFTLFLFLFCRIAVNSTDIFILMNSCWTVDLSNMDKFARHFIRIDGIVRRLLTCLTKRNKWRWVHRFEH